VVTEDILEIEDSADDRREFERKPLTVEIRFDGGDATGRATTRDIGLGGLYMATNAELHEGTPLQMRIMFGETEFNVTGTVVYFDAGHGVGVRFHDLDETAENLLRRNLPQT
jgi:hypothetical protein